jgi:hypothetical protein
MMRFEHKVKYLSIALAVLLVGFGLGEFFAPERMTTRSETGSLLPGKGSDVARVDIGNTGTSLVLVRAGGTWGLVDGSDRLPIQASRIDSLLAELGKAGRKRPVASAKEAWKNLGLDEATAKSLKLSDEKGKVILDLRVGSYGATGSEVYARLAGSDASFAIGSGISSWLGVDRGAWLDKRLFATVLEAGGVQALSLKADMTLEDTAGAAATPAAGAASTKAAPLHFAWRLERSGEGWKGGARELDAVAVESTLRAILNLEAVDLAARAPEGAFAKIGASISLETGKGGNRLVEVGTSAGEGRFWVRATESGKASPLAFKVSSYSLGLILKDEENFTKK